MLFRRLNQSIMVVNSGAGTSQRQEGGGQLFQRAYLIPKYSQLLSSIFFFNTVQQKVIFNRARVVTMSHNRPTKKS